MSLMEVVKGHEKVERGLEKLESKTLPGLLAEPAGNFSELDVPNSVSNDIDSNKRVKTYPGIFLAQDKSRVEKPVQSERVSSIQIH